MSETGPAAIHDVRFPNESDEYRAARNRLLEAEMALRRQTEAVAALRRALPPGGGIPEDYVFQEGDDARPTRLSELFGDKSVLLLYSYMYGPAMARPCPSCTSILDSLDGAAPHVSQRAAIAAVALADRAFSRSGARARLAAAATAVVGREQLSSGLPQRRREGGATADPERLCPQSRRRDQARLRH
jgi:hypothetical protein